LGYYAASSRRAQFSPAYAIIICAKFDLRRTFRNVVIGQAGSCLYIGPGVHRCSKISRSHLKITDVSKAKKGKVHPEDPKTLGPGVEKISRHGDGDL
jgi:hypothetical protein